MPHKKQRVAEKKQRVKPSRTTQKLREIILRKKIWIRNKICPECRIKAIDCDCDFTCPACKTKGKYDSMRNIVCPNDDCRVRRFFTH